MKFAQFFSKIQETDWYQEFLSPVMDLIPEQSKLLDIGTGSGKMLALLAQTKSVESTGLDTNDDMLNEAQKKLNDLSVQLVKIKPNHPLPISDNSFDNVTICSVLFHLKPEEVSSLLAESRRVLKPNGKIIILTPTGKGGLLKLTRQFLSKDNTSIYVWYRATKSRARAWTKQQLLLKYCATQNLHYSHQKTLWGFAQLEIIST